MATVFGLPVDPDVCTMYSTSVGATAGHATPLTSGGDGSATTSSTHTTRSAVGAPFCCSRKRTAFARWHTSTVIFVAPVIACSRSSGYMGGIAQYTAPIITAPAIASGSSLHRSRHTPTTAPRCMAPPLALYSPLIHAHALRYVSAPSGPVTHGRPPFVRNESRSISATVPNAPLCSSGPASGATVLPRFHGAPPGFAAASMAAPYACTSACSRASLPQCAPLPDTVAVPFGSMWILSSKETS